MITWWDEMLYQINSEIRCKYMLAQVTFINAQFFLTFLV